MPTDPRFTKEEEEEIRRRAERQFMTDIAKDYNVNVHTIHRIVHKTYNIKNRPTKSQKLKE